MKVLAACEESQEVCKAFREKGHGETKSTCLWLKGLPKLIPTNIVEGREQRIWKMPPGPDRAKERSKTFPGIARQWQNNGEGSEEE